MPEMSIEETDRHLDQPWIERQARWTSHRMSPLRVRHEDSLDAAGQQCIYEQDALIDGHDIVPFAREDQEGWIARVDVRDRVIRI